MALQLRAPTSRETLTHAFAHHAVVILRPIVIVFLAATVALMATFWPLAVVTGFIAVFAGLGLWIASGVESRSPAVAMPRVTAPASRREPSGPERREAANHDGVDVVAQAEAEADADGSLDADRGVVPGGEIDARIVLRETKAVAGLVAGLALLALLLGVVLFEWPMIGLGVAVVMLYAALVTFPAWAAWIEGDVESAEAEQAAADRSSAGRAAPE